MVIEWIDSGSCYHTKEIRCKSLPLEDTHSAEIICLHSIQKSHFWMRGQVVISQNSSQWWGCLQVKIGSAAVTFRWHKCQECLQHFKNNNKKRMLNSKQGFWRQALSWILSLLKVIFQHFRQVCVNHINPVKDRNLYFCVGFFLYLHIITCNLPAEGIGNSRQISQHLNVCGPLP